MTEARCGTLDGCRAHIERREPYCDRCSAVRRVNQKYKRGGHVHGALLLTSLPPSPAKAAELAKATR